MGENSKGLVVGLTSGIMLIVVGAIMAYIGFFTVAAVSLPIGATLNPHQAQGSFYFTGNVSNGELVNISYGASQYTFEFNTTGGTSYTSVVVANNAIRVNASDIGSWNKSINVAGNLTAAINGNASTAALVTATNLTNITSLVSVTNGVANNGIVLTSNAAKITTTTMSGGVDGETAYAGIRSNVNTTFILLSILLIVSGVGVLLATLMSNFGGGFRTGR